jgi:hypothetical protein
LRRTCLVGLITLALVIITTTEAAADIRSIGRCRARGDFAICVASGSVDNPSRLWVKVRSTPNQSVDGSWTVVCSRGFGAGSRDGNFSGVTPLKRRIRMPYTNPDDCTLSGSAQLSDSGRLVVILLARV